MTARRRVVAKRYLILVRAGVKFIMTIICCNNTSAFINFARLRAVTRADHLPLLKHIEQPRGASVTNLEPPLKEGGRSLTALHHQFSRFLVEWIIGIITFVIIINCYSALAHDDLIG